jgi:hypothetical protein
VRDRHASRKQEYWRDYEIVKNDLRAAEEGFVGELGRCPDLLRLEERTALHSEFDVVTGGKVYRVPRAAVRR